MAKNYYKHPDLEYFDLLSKVLNFGEEQIDRTGTGVKRIFDHQMRFDLRETFPLLSTKYTAPRLIYEELLWMLRGETNIQSLKDKNVNIWNEWADQNGDLGPVYGKQWRFWQTESGTIDQIATVIDNIRTSPYSRRHIVSAWNVGQLEDMALPPCHLLFQFYVSQSGYLHTKLFQRSADIFLGVPFNIASYSLLTHLVAQQCNLKPGSFVWSGTDCHIYLNHLDAVKTQLNRDPYPSPTLYVEPAASIDEYTSEHFELRNYQYHPRIKAPISV